MNYEVYTDYSSDKVISVAKDRFGPKGLDLEVIKEQEDYISFRGSGGHIEIEITPSDSSNSTKVEILTVEWDGAVREFMKTIKA